MQWQFKLYVINIKLGKLFKLIKSSILLS